MTKIISIINFKGGVGKTTSSINIGAELARREKRVLIIDSDPQSNLTFGFGISPDEENNIYTYLQQGFFGEPIKINSHLDVIPSHISFVNAEINFSTEMGREYLLKELISKIKSNYDYIIIDCPPSGGLIFINVLAASDKLLIPMIGEPFSVSGIKELLRAVSKIQVRINPNLEIGGVFLTHFRNLILHKESREAMSNYFKNKFLKTQIRENISISEAQTMGKDVFAYKPKSNGAQDYIELTNELLKRI